MYSIKVNSPKPPDPYTHLFVCVTVHNNEPENNKCNTNFYHVSCTEQILYKINKIYELPMLCHRSYDQHPRQTLAFPVPWKHNCIAELKYML
jgi:hypothetical protein